MNDRLVALARDLLAAQDEWERGSGLPSNALSEDEARAAASTAMALASSDFDAVWEALDAPVEPIPTLTRAANRARAVFGE